MNDDRNLGYADWMLVDTTLVAIGCCVRANTLRFNADVAHAPDDVVARLLAVLKSYDFARVFNVVRT